MGDYFEGETSNKDIPEVVYIKEELIVEESLDLDVAIKQEPEQESLDKVPKFDGELYRCELCSKAFCTSANLKRHKAMVHGTFSKPKDPGIRPYKCDKCDKAFKNMTALRIHNSNAHHTERPFRCVLCPKSFAIVASLDSHLKKHKGGPFKCDLCAKDCKSPTAVTIHKAIMHNAEDKFYCEKCEETYITQGAYREHMVVHGEEKNISCGQCGKMFKNRRNLNSHKWYAHAPEKPFQCEVCSERFANASYLKIHFTRHTKETPYKCDLCSSAYKTQHFLNRHKVRAHSIGGKFSCGKCGEQFMSPSAIKKHELTHTNDKYFNCDLCDKSSMDKSELFRHKMYAHATEKPFHCKVCLKSFANASSLKYHSVTHSVDKPHKCDQCTKSFKMQGALNRHMVVEHNTGNKFSCEQCGKWFTLLSNLKEHLIRHSGENSFTCEICAKTFMGRISLGNHKRFAHAIERPFQCGVCPETFASIPSLRMHASTHEENNTHKCDQCPKAFKIPINLANHKAKEHGEGRKLSSDKCGEDETQEVEPVVIYLPEVDLEDESEEDMNVDVKREPEEFDGCL